MAIKYIQIPADTDFKSYLKEAEAQVDELSDEELEAAEAEVEARINVLANPPIPIFSRTTSKARAKANRSWKTASIGGFLMAAMALLYVQNQTVNNQDHWQTKGVSDAAPVVCEATVVPLESAIVVKANCQSEIAIEGLENGLWKRMEAAQINQGLVENANGPIDFRKYAGARLRLSAENGVSEEFSIPKTP